MKENADPPVKTYDVVETAIDLSKKLRGTWEKLARQKGIRPWAAEITTPVINHHESPVSQQDEPETRP